MMYRHVQFFLLAALIVVSSLFYSRISSAQNISTLLEFQTEVYYMISMSGNVNQEHFSNVTGILTLGLPGHLSLNQHTLILVGYPRSNVRNSFFWNADKESMEIFGTELYSEITSTKLGRQTDNHFYYLSPVLLEVPETHQEEDLIEQAEKDALPTRIYATFGELEIVFSSNKVHGTVFMKGWDQIGNEYVTYRAQFTGTPTTARPPQN